jgi:hypothetical protein
MNVRYGASIPIHPAGAQSAAGVSGEQLELPQ